ncbi:MAG: DUF11 domain-containing protein [Myxococcales bacterium]|nr:DUF11 domain-containing protein [Myxococcales bacterium]
MNSLGKQPLSARAMRLGLLGTSVLAVLAAVPGLFVRPAQAAPTLRYSTDLRGDLVLLGNSGGFDCRAMPASPEPVRGTVDRAACGRSIEDSSPDVFWSSDLPSEGRAVADAATLPGDARTTALLQIPSTAKITYARIYWSSSLNEGYTPSPTIFIDRPGAAGFKEIAVSADPKDIVRDAGGSSLVFQASADISRIVQTYGPGAYRVRGYATSPLVDLGQDVAWVSWSILAAYRDDSAPVRNITIFDGLTRVGPDAEVPQPITGFAVPPTGTPEGRLAIIAYEGDSEKPGDSLIWNGTPLADAQNPSDNFFNSTRSRLGQAVTVPGDLPQLSGAPNSMASVDMDIVDISGLLTPRATSANVALRVTSDVVYLGVLATAIVSKKPILETTLTYPPRSSMRPGDVLEFTSSTRNIGDDTAQNAIITHTLPAGLSYVPGSVQVIAGPNQGPKTDALGDDQVEYDAATRSLIIRLGSGANASQGGSISPQDAASVVKYQLRIDDTAAPGDLPTQSSASATPSATPMATPVSYPSGNGVQPGAPTVIVVPPCGSNADCAAGAPVCDLSAMPARCGNFCKTDGDCQGASGGNTVCDQDTRTCVECTTMSSGACSARDTGAQCLVGAGRCGCASNTDCGGRSCDLATGRCPKSDADLSVQVAVSPDPATVDTPVRYSIRIHNKGPAMAPPGAKFVYTVPDGASIESVTPGPGFRCTLSDRTVTCRYLNKIAPGAASATVDIVVKPRPLSPNGSEEVGTPMLVSQVVVSSDSSTDPNPGDNTVHIRTELGLYRSAGGGISCALASDRTQASRYSSAALLLSLGLLLRSLRRRSRGALSEKTETV